MFHGFRQSDTVLNNKINVIIKFLMKGFMKLTKMKIINVFFVVTASIFLPAQSTAAEAQSKAVAEQPDPKMTREPQSEEEATTRWENLRGSLKTLIPVDENGFYNIRNSYLPKAEAILQLAQEAQKNNFRKNKNKKLIQQILDNSKKSFESAKASMETYEAILAKPVTVLIAYEFKIVEEALIKEDFEKIAKKANQARTVLKFMSKIAK